MIYPTVSGADRSASDASIATLVDLLRQRAHYQPEQRAYTFLSDEDGDGLPITYGELDRRARAIAAWLQAHAAAGERALLLYPPGLDYICGFFGCLYAGVIAVPTYPPDLSRPERSIPRFQALVADAKATIVLTTQAVLDMTATVTTLAPGLSRVRWLASDRLASELAADWRDPDIDGASLAFLQYTSGSTSAPRGVMLSHTNLLYNSALISDALQTSAESVPVIWLPPYHDMGLIGGIIQPIYRSFECTLMSPLAFLQRPLRWLQAMSSYKATISGGPNFAYELCVRKTTPEQRAELDLSNWQVAFNGAEPVRPATLERFAAAFAPAGFRREAFFPCYGLAEATLMVTSHSAGRRLHTVPWQAADLAVNRAVPAGPADTQTRELVGCGGTLTGQQVIIVDPTSGRQCPPGQVGEVWVSGPSVAQGYWNRPAETLHTFQAYATDSGAGPFLRTGDLGFLQDGELFVTGRLKDLIILDGRNLYPQDIELTVESSHQAIRAGCSAAFAVERDGSEQLVVVAEVERSFLSAQRRRKAGNDATARPAADSEAVVAAIRSAVSEQHNVRVETVVLLKTGHIPKTSSGKIQRHVCKAGLMAGSLETVASSTLAPVELEQLPAMTLLPDRAAILATPAEQRPQLVATTLTTLAAHVMRHDPAGMDPAQALSTYGLDSLNAVELTHAIEQQFGVTLPIVALLRGDSLNQLSAAINAQLEAAPVAAPEAVASEDTVQPLTYGQRALWFLQQLSPRQSVYTLTSQVRLRGAVDTAALQRALAQLVARQPGLRTTFTARSGEPVQVVHDDLAPEFQIEDATGWDERTLEERLHELVYRPFNLERGPLLRLQLWRRAPDELVAILSVHHLITDFWSLALLVEELVVLYRAETAGTAPPKLPQGAGYGEYVAAEQALVDSTAGKRLWQYWQRQLAGELAVLALPTDRLRSPTPSYSGATRSRRIDPATSQQLFELARTHGATPFMLVLATFYVLLYRHTQQTDLIVGVPQAQRSGAWARSMGYFVNALPIRTRIDPEQGFTELLTRTRNVMLAAFEHGAFPFPLMVERLQPEREPGRSPVFQVMAVWQKTVRPGGADLTAFALNETGGRIDLGDATLESLTLEPRVVPFELTLLAGEIDSQLTLTLEYNSALFEPATADYLLDHLVALLTGIATDPASQIATLALATPDEQALIRSGWGAHRPTEPATALIHELIAARAVHMPQATALVGPHSDDRAPTIMRYAELEQRTNQLAHYLQRHGVGPETVVAVCIERSPLIAVTLLAILKAGGVYLPLEPNTPPERLELIIADAQARVVLTQERLQPLFAGSSVVTSDSCKLICLDTAAAQIADQAAHSPQSAVQAANAAYIFYTSGSTGTPKGVVIEHGALAGHCLAVEQHYALTHEDCVLQFAATTFDPSIEQILPPLLAGARVAFRDDRLWTADEFAAQAIDLGLTVINVPPAYWQHLAEVWVERPELLNGHLLRLVIIGGDRIAAETIALWRQTPVGAARLLNAYGPTEATITATTAEIELDDADATATRPVVIGRPLPGRTAYILDETGTPVAIGVPGELYLGGGGIARGYLGQPELTAAVFVTDHFAGIPGARLYKTGDLARYHSDGTIEFLGRIDEQVKIRGMRVEPDEIAAVLRRQEQVRDALVMAVADERGDKRLLGYVLAANAVEQQSRAVGATTQAPDLDPVALRARLQSQLPEYMLPAAIVVLDAWPLTASGKIDRRALPEPPHQPAERTDSFVGPRNPIEDRLAQIWAQVLKLDRIGVHDNFFALGGHSLLATRLIAQIQSAFYTQLPLLTLFERPTVAAMAEHILANQLAESDVEELAALLDELEQLPDEIARDLLTD